MNDKLSEFGRSLVGITTVPEDEPGEMAELVD